MKTDEEKLLDELIEQLNEEIPDWDDDQKKIVHFNKKEEVDRLIDNLVYLARKVDEMDFGHVAMIFNIIRLSIEYNRDVELSSFMYKFYKNIIEPKLKGNKKDV